MTLLKKYISRQPYSLKVPERNSLMLGDINALTKYHAANCAPYRRILDGLWEGRTSARCIEEVPYLPVSLFKTHKLQSVDEDTIKNRLMSSGTTGSLVSKIYVDKKTSCNQQLCLTNSLAHILGAKRLPMLVLDTDATFRTPQYMNARGAGVLGMMRFGRDHHFALTPDLDPAFDVVASFLDRHGHRPFFMFGFTFLVWAKFFLKLKDMGLDLSNGVLVHSGGWKKMEEHAVDNQVFRSSFKKQFQLKKIYR